MTHPQDKHAVPEPPADPARVLEQVETLLTKQLALARKGRYEALSALDAAVRQCTQHLRQLDGPPPGCEAQAERIGKLQRELGLALAQHQSELAERLERLRRGRPGLAAYAAAS